MSIHGALFLFLGPHLLTSFFSHFFSDRVSPFYKHKGSPKYYAYTLKEDDDGETTLDRKYVLRSRHGDPMIRTRKERYSPANLGEVFVVVAAALVVVVFVEIVAANISSVASAVAVAASASTAAAAAAAAFGVVGVVVVVVVVVVTAAALFKFYCIFFLFPCPV